MDPRLLLLRLLNPYDDLRVEYIQIIVTTLLRRWDGVAGAVRLICAVSRPVRVATTSRMDRHLGQGPWSPPATPPPNGVQPHPQPGELQEVLQQLTSLLPRRGAAR